MPWVADVQAKFRANSRDPLKRRQFISRQYLANLYLMKSPTISAFRIRERLSMSSGSDSASNISQYDAFRQKLGRQGHRPVKKSLVSSYLTTTG
jgi:hypothetical protein